MNVLAIGAHPDDIEIACAGTLAKCVKRGDRVTVCHVSTGNLGHVVIPPDELTLIRAEEAKKAGSMAGIKVICAGFNDLDIFDGGKEARDRLSLKGGERRISAPGADDDFFSGIGILPDCFSHRLNRSLSMHRDGTLLLAFFPFDDNERFAQKTGRR